MLKDLSDLLLQASNDGFLNSVKLRRNNKEKRLKCTENIVFNFNPALHPNDIRLYGGITVFLLFPARNIFKIIDHTTEEFSATARQFNFIYFGLLLSIASYKNTAFFLASINKSPLSLRLKNNNYKYFAKS